MADDEGWQQAAPRRKPSTKAAASNSAAPSTPNSKAKPAQNSPKPSSSTSSSSSTSTPSKQGAPASSPSAGSSQTASRSPAPASASASASPAASTGSPAPSPSASKSSTASSWRSSSTPSTSSPLPLKAPGTAAPTAPEAAKDHKEFRIDSKVGKVLQFTSGAVKEDMVILKVDESYCYFGNQHGSIRVRYSPETKMLNSDFEIHASHSILLPQDALYGSGVLLHDSAKGLVLLGETWTHSYIDFCYRIRHLKSHNGGKHLFPVPLFCQLLSATRFDLMSNKELDKLLGLKEAFLSSLETFITDELKSNRLAEEEFTLLEHLVKAEKSNRDDLVQAKIGFEDPHNFSIPKGNFTNPNFHTKTSFMKNPRENAIQELIKALNLAGKPPAVVDNPAELIEKVNNISETPALSAPYSELLGVVLGELQVFVLDVDSEKFKVVKPTHWQYTFRWETYEEAKKKMEPLHFAKLIKFLAQKPAN